MFIPKLFTVTNMDDIWEFVQAHSFATLVTVEHGKPIATHLPLILHKIEDDYFITGHMAYANPQWRTLENTNDQALVMFQGPHAYISSSWYHHENVPTWNYQSVHMYGKARIMSEQELKEDLSLLMKKYEGDRKNGILWEDLSQETKKQMKGIVGFTINVEDIQAAYKLSQNRNEKDYTSIIDNLRHEGDMHSLQMADIMEKREKRQ